MDRISSDPDKFSAPLILGHRGSSLVENFPENSLPAFREALDLGADGVELDVYLSADGELMVCHDRNLKRLTGLDGNIDEMRSTDISNLRFMGYENRPEFYIPSLAEVFGEVEDNFICNIEIKRNPGSYRKISAKLHTYLSENHLEERVWLSSFDPFFLRTWKRTGSPVATAWLFEDWNPVSWLVCRFGFIDFLHPHKKMLSSQNSLEKTGKKVCFWTVNNETELMEARKNNNLLGLITDDVRLGRKIFSGTKNAPV